MCRVEREARGRQEGQRKSLTVGLVTAGLSRTAERDSGRSSNSPGLGDGVCVEGRGGRGRLPSFNLVTRRPIGNTRGGAGRGETCGIGVPMIPGSGGKVPCRELEGKLQKVCFPMLMRE